MHSGKKVSELPWNAPLVGTEFIPMVQNGLNVKVLATDLAAVPVDGLSTVTNNVPLNASSFVLVGTPISLFLGAEYLVRVDQPSTGYVKLVKVLALYANDTILLTNYGTLESGTLSGTFNVSVEASGPDIVVTATQTDASVGDEIIVKIVQLSVK